jgi:chromosome segregation ATPase
MIEQLISDLEAKIRAQAIGEPAKGELLQLLAQLRTEIVALEKTSEDTREKQKELQSSVDELRSSMAGFEQSHPKLVQALNSISNTLSNWGI